jgi:hypothetical protein
MRSKFEKEYDQKEWLIYDLSCAVVLADVLVLAVIWYVLFTTF